jgi:cytochrome P450
MDAVANPVPINVISWLIGFRDGDMELLLLSAADSTLMVGGAMTLDELTPLIERTAEVGAWINEQLAAGDASPDVILGTIAQAVTEKTIPTSQGVIILQTLLSAGGESTTSLIGNAGRILAEQPELQNQLRSHPELVANFVEEVLRLESPFRSESRRHSTAGANSVAEPGPGPAADSSKKPALTSPRATSAARQLTPLAEAARWRRI